MRYIRSAIILSCLGLAACANDAQVASSNLSQAADNFQINRRIVFYNGITNDYILVIEGLSLPRNLPSLQQSFLTSIYAKLASAPCHSLGKGLLLALKPTHER